MFDKAGQVSLDELLPLHSNHWTSEARKGNAWSGAHSWETPRIQIYFNRSGVSPRPSSQLTLKLETFLPQFKERGRDFNLAFPISSLFSNHRSLPSALDVLWNDNHPVVCTQAARRVPGVFRNTVGQEQECRAPGAPNPSGPDSSQAPVTQIQYAGGLG